MGLSELINAPINPSAFGIEGPVTAITKLCPLFNDKEGGEFPEPPLFIKVTPGAMSLKSTVVLFSVAKIETKVK